MKLKLDKAQRRFVAKHLMNGGYGALVALAFSQIIAERASLVLVVLGLIIYFSCWRTAVKFIKGT